MQEMNMVFFYVWTVDGKIMFKNSDNGKPNAYYGQAGWMLKIYGEENYTIGWVYFLSLFHGFYSKMCMGL